MNEPRLLSPAQWAAGQAPLDDPKPTEIDPLPNPTGWRLLIQPMRVEEKTQGGIVLVPESKQYNDTACHVGKVIKQGPTCYQGEQFSVPWCHVGDYVLYSKHVGQRVEIKELDGTITPYLIMNDDDIRGLVNDPARIRMYL